MKKMAIILLLACISTGNVQASVWDFDAEDPVAVREHLAFLQEMINDTDAAKLLIPVKAKTLEQRVQELKDVQKKSVQEESKKN